MEDKNNRFEPTGETEEIILDDEEFEMLLARSEAMKHSKEEAPTLEDEFDDIVIEEEEEYTLDTESLFEEEKPKKKSITRAEKVADPEIEEINDDDEEEEAFVAGFFKDGLADKLVYLVGALIILFVVIVGTVVVTSRNKATGTSVDMSQLGNDVAAIGVIGKDGITSVFEAQAKRLEDLADAAEEIGYDEVDEETGLVNVSLSLTSILKDLKIKFINKNNKLVANVPFEAEVTDSNGSVKTYTDEDKDGIIYIKDIPGGTYKVKMVKLDGFAKLYSFNTSEEGIKVKNELEYTKVDVSNEVKPDTEAKSGEDSANNDTAQEGELQDTVEFVISTRTPVTNESGFEALDSSKVQDPRKTLAAKDASGIARFKKLAGANNIADPTGTEGEGGEEENIPTALTLSGPSSMEGGDTGEVKATVDGDVTSYTWTSSNDGLIEITDGQGTSSLSIKAHEVSEDTDVTVTCEATYGESGENKLTASHTITVKKKAEIPQEDKSSFTLNCPSVPNPMKVGDTFDFMSSATVTVTDKDGNTLSAGSYELSYSTSSKDVATVSNGVIKAVGKGTATITVTCKASNMTECSQKIDVNVEKKSTASATLTLDITKTTIFVGDEKIKITPTLTGVTDTSVQWSSSDESIAKVGKGGGVTAVSAGSNGKASVTITCTSVEVPSLSATCTVTVRTNPKEDKTTKLTDKDGNQVYVYDASKKEYREAVYADYYTTDVKFFTAVAVTYKYTGWWTLSGKTYFFDKNGNKVTGDQVILGTKYSFSAEGVLINGSGSFGIDVSKWNGDINWSNVAKSGVSFAIIRSGFRGSTEGGLYEDTKFYSNIKNATASGIKVGVYFFTQATNEVEAVEEASMVLGQVSGYNITYPIFLDVESAGAGGRAEGLSAAQRTAVIKAFCKTISNGGYTAGVYANKSWFENKINTSELTAYKIWLAQYNTSVTYTSTRYDLWQYSSNGSISGISGKVDLNRSYLGY